MEHSTLVDEAKLKELLALYKLGWYRRVPKLSAKNRVDTRWVIKWKAIEGERAIKARITMRGFKDMQESMETFAGTASRWAQRVVCSVCVQHSDFKLWSFDVSAAFCKRYDVL